MGPLGQITENQKSSCKFIFKGFDVPLGLSWSFCDKLTCTMIL
jgi:hypothetical protein